MTIDAGTSTRCTPRPVEETPVRDKHALHAHPEVEIQQGQAMYCPPSLEDEIQVRDKHTLPASIGSQLFELQRTRPRGHVRGRSVAR
jgi:hypothetical protein